MRKYEIKRGLFYLCLLALGCSIDYAEVEINDVLGEDDNITFIIRIYKAGIRDYIKVPLYFPDEFKSRFSNDERAVHWSGFAHTHCILKLVSL